MTHERPVSHELLKRSDAEVEDRVSQLKLLAGLLEKPSDRLLCLGEMLHVRSEQLQAHIEAKAV